MDRGFLFGLWIEDAKKAAVGEEEERLFLLNLKTQVTVWGTSASGWSEIEDYANREQGGLVSSYYLARCVIHDHVLDALPSLQVD